MNIEVMIQNYGAMGILAYVVYHLLRRHNKQIDKLGMEILKLRLVMLRLVEKIEGKIEGEKNGLYTD